VWRRLSRRVRAGEVFSAVSEEVSRLLDAQAAAIGRVEPDGSIVVVATGGTARDEVPIGTRFALESDTALAAVV
jgi:hypothetical protein